MDWIKNNKTLAYGIGAVVGLMICIIFITKFWSYAIVAVVCLGVGYYYGRRNKNEKASEKEKNREGFL